MFPVYKHTNFPLPSATLYSQQILFSPLFPPISQQPYIILMSKHTHHATFPASPNPPTFQLSLYCTFFVKHGWPSQTPPTPPLVWKASPSMHFTQYDFTCYGHCSLSKKAWSYLSKFFFFFSRHRPVENWGHPYRYLSQLMTNFGVNSQCSWNFP